MKDIFTKVLANLNDAQRRAVDVLEGVVMVVAGPGTGKTQVLGARVANLLKNTDTAAENILCLTFTEAATAALRNRLLEFIGTDAHRVNIYTYHAFCNRIIQEHKHLFGYSELDAASELDIIEIAKEIIDELQNNHPLKRFKGDAYFDSSNLIKLFGLLKKDRLSSAAISELIASTVNKAHNEEQYRYKRDTKLAKKDDLNPKYYELQAQLKKLDAAAALVDTYNAKLLQRRRYDYNDMINWIIDEFEQNQDLLLTYQEQFQHVLVDEYQDTNGAQNKLVYQLINYWDNPNVFVVGDDDQSIYKFQGANVANIHHFQQKYKQYAKLIVLEDNYRSNPAILAASNELIQHNEERLVGKIDGLNKNIRSSHSVYSQITHKVQINDYPNTYQEIIGLGQSLLKLNKEGVAWQDMAIIYRNHDQSQDLMRYLMAQEIPYNVSVSMDVLTIPIVKQFFSLLNYLKLENEKLDKGQALLFEILHSFNFKHLSPFEISQLSSILGKDYNKGWREQLYQKLDEDRFSFLAADSRSELARFLADVEYWLKQLHNVNLQALVEQLMAKGGFVSRALAGPDNIFEIQCLKTVFDFLKDETSKNPSLKLTDFLAIIDLMVANKLKLSLNKVVHGLDGINLMTAHGSKGLEFDYVFILGCTANKWEKNGQRLPFNLNKVIEGEPLRAHEEEGRRLFYVALTRAKKGLTVSYAHSNTTNKPLSKSVYVAEIEENESTQTKHESSDDKVMMSFFSETLNVSSASFQELTKLDFVDQQLERFRMNATNLNAYLNCPITFFYQHIIQVPSAKNEHMSFGSAVHAALELYFKQMIDHPQKAFPDKSVLLDRFKSVILQNQESFTKESLKRFLDHGLIVLDNYYKESKTVWQSNTNVQVEVDVKNVEIEGVPIRGKIDKLVELDRELHVIDYKTGKYSNARPKIHPPVASDKLKEGEKDHNKLLGGDYWRQLVFYRILLDADPRYSKAVTAGFLDFVEPEKEQFHQAKVIITPEDKAAVVTQIVEAYKSIMAKQFDHGCGEEHCIWCNFNAYYLNREHVNDKNLLRNELQEMEER